MLCDEAMGRHDEPVLLPGMQSGVCNALPQPVAVLLCVSGRGCALASLRLGFHLFLHTALPHTPHAYIFYTEPPPLWRGEGVGVAAPPHTDACCTHATHARLCCPRDAGVADSSASHPVSALILAAMPSYVLLSCTGTGFRALRGRQPREMVSNWRSCRAALCGGGEGPLPQAIVGGFGAASHPLSPHIPSYIAVVEFIPPVAVDGDVAIPPHAPATLLITRVASF